MTLAGSLKIVTARERPDLAQRAGERSGEVWPEYNKHGDVLTEYWDRLGDLFPVFQFVLYDEADDALLAEGHSIPCAWDGTPAGLPAGIDGLIAEAFALREAGGSANTLSALAIEIQPERQSRGLSRVMIGAMAELAGQHGFANLIAPVRPNWKERYPLTPIERYAIWRREDGLLFDPWMRVHERLGAEMLKPEAHSLRITAPVAQWEERVGMAFPETGEYVFPGGLATLAVDRERDLGRYWEPNVWMRHAVS
jgi:GNAT superfamily N-acetyltransferase